jgi:hypothetical protein
VVYRSSVSNRTRSWFPAVLAVSMLAMVPAGTAKQVGQPVLQRASSPRALLRSSLAFIPNQGQIDSRVAFDLQGQDTTAFFTSGGVTLAVPDPSAGGRYALRLRFPGSRPTSPLGTDRLAGTVSSFIGPQANWHTGIPTFGGVVYRSLWPGIDLRFSGTQSRLEYSFVVRPGADPGEIRVAYAGSTALEVHGENLTIASPAGPLTELAPRTFQRIGGRRAPVGTTYRLLGPHRFGFSLAPYDRSSTVVIDPTVLVYAGFLGGSNSDFGVGISTDAAQNAYVVGSTNSPDFPATPGPFSGVNGKEDAFIVKVDPSGTLLFSGFVGGSGQDQANGMALDAAGNIYIAGFTTSTDFPVSGGPNLAFGGDHDAFVTAVRAGGTGLIYSGYTRGSFFPRSSGGENERVFAAYGG